MISGSPKQIEWAHSIRARVVAALTRREKIIDFLVERLGKPTKSRPVMEALIAPNLKALAEVLFDEERAYKVIERRAEIAIEIELLNDVIRGLTLPLETI